MTFNANAGGRWTLLAAFCVCVGVTSSWSASVQRAPNSVFVDALEGAAVRPALTGWSLEQKVGQLVMVGYRSLEQIRKIQPGGVILFSWSMKSVEQTRELNERLRKLGRDELKSPMFIATDHEGGKVLRLRKGLTAFPDAAAVGQADDMSAFEVGKAMGHELASLGFNMNLAPVLDLGGTKSFLENRSWGEAGMPVGMRTTAFIRGLQSARVLAVAKHFPGHGGGSLDSHFGLPKIQKPFLRVWREDLLPFRQAVRDGVPAVMTAHVEIPSVARGPASLAPEFVTGILREKMKFTGLVLTDDLEMGGVTQRLGAKVEDLALRALIAGTDMIMVVWSEPMQRKIVERLVGAVKSGEVSEQWLDEKVTHILGLKAHFIDHGQQLENPFWRENFRRPAALKLARRIASNAVTWTAGQREAVLAQFGKAREKAWSVTLPTAYAERIWKSWRPGDKTLLVNRRPSTEDLAKLRAHLNAATLAGEPLVVITGPRASAGEENFKVIYAELMKSDAAAKGAIPILWAHQGQRPFESRRPASDVRMGMLSLFSSSAESLSVLTSYLSASLDKQGGQVGAGVRQ